VGTEVRDGFSRRNGGRAVTVTASPEDWIYMMLVDRFNNPAEQPRHASDEPFGNFQGGTLPGITAQLGYVRSLGARALWLSPVLQM
jgi:glycosidase